METGDLRRFGDIDPSAEPDKQSYPQTAVLMQVAKGFIDSQGDPVTEQTTATQQGIESFSLEGVLDPSINLGILSDGMKELLENLYFEFVKGWDEKTRDPAAETEFNNLSLDEKLDHANKQFENGQSYDIVDGVRYQAMRAYLLGYSEERRDGVLSAAWLEKQLREYEAIEQKGMSTLTRGEFVRKVLMDFIVKYGETHEACLSDETLIAGDAFEDLHEIEAELGIEPFKLERVLNPSINIDSITNELRECLTQIYYTFIRALEEYEFGLLDDYDVWHELKELEQMIAGYRMMGNLHRVF
ncbi:hypothetical protein FWH58_01710 [Candidatus Saccharibacteria bacterium]|nr:hypothetical protein [Candidatus Saccharibacteria bacterium]